jgi:glycosyltransferase involved in cell wall biosynthesis
MPSAPMVQGGAAREPRPEGSLAARPAHAPRARPRLCFVSPRGWPVLSADAGIRHIGGAELQQCTLARLFAGAGYRVSMVCFDYGQPEGVRVDGVSVHKAYRPEAGLPGLRFFHPRLTSMWRALAAADAEVYCARAASAWAGIVVEFCRRHGRRSIYSGASNMDFVPGEGGQIRYARDRWIYRRGLARADAILAQNEAQRTSCRANYGREAVVIPSCYAQPPRMARSDAADRVLWAGRIEEGKRPEMFLELAARLPHRRFTLVGGPGAGQEPLFERLRERAATLPNVELTGFLPLAEVEPWFDRARLLVNTSCYEGMPNTFLQAWARGVPTLATVDVGTPVHRVFRDAEEGAAAIEALFQSRVAWEAASRRCREHFEHRHSSAEVLARYERLFEELRA